MTVERCMKPRKPKVRPPEEAATEPDAVCDNRFIVTQHPDEAPGDALAKNLLGPGARHGLVAASFANGVFPAGFDEKAGLVGSRAMVDAEAVKAAGGDLTLVSTMLTSQAVVLDTMFTEFARRASANMGEYLGASERYARLALKAQGNCRATLEALTKLHQPREQIVKHITVTEGGQAVVADQFHNHQGAAQNGPDQSHAQSPCSPPLRSPDSIGGGVPIPCGEGAAQMSDARRN